jgi:hypothetical protein
MTKSKKATQAALEALHGALANNLAAKIKNGEATAADLSVARQFLKDNNIDALPTKGTPLSELQESLPEFNPDDEDDAIRH